ncbi:ATP/GTP-binding protein [Streptomyces chartreusis]
MAQFVQPFDDALQDKAYMVGALLAVVGYLLYAKVQRLNAASTARRENEEALARMVQQLDRRVQHLSKLTLHPQAQQMIKPLALEYAFREALEAGPEVRLAAMGFTGETLADQLKNILQALSVNPRRTDSLRVLVPDLSKSIEVPGLVDTDGKISDAPHFREHLRRQIAEYERSLQYQVQRMADQQRGTLTVEFRMLHLSPSLKLYFINNDVMYEGIYDKLDLRPNPWATAALVADHRLLDLIGHDSLLTRWSTDDSDHARKIIHRRRELFETFWSVARQLSPDRRPDGD